MVFGRRRSPAASAEIASGGTGPREALEGLLVPALERPPCWVAFSGGRDSSAILAVATKVAREHGLEDPIPLTLRFALHPRTRETDWQELTVRHLGLKQWEVHEITSELEAVGPIAAPALRRHGLYWPPNAHTLARLFQAASGGVLITGNGGDEVFSPLAVKRPSLGQLIRARPRRKVLKYVTFGLLPRRLRTQFWVRKSLPLPWLRPTPLREVRRLYAAKFHNRGPSWRDALRGLIESRYLELTLQTFDALADDADVRLVQPFYDPRFLGAVADVAPTSGFVDRATAMRVLFGDLLPRRSVERPTKASFTEVFYGPSCRAFADSWDGTGLDTALVDPDALRREWAKPRPDFRAMTPLQAAWLASGAQD
jgi:asparagine synthase (glutamine-hydrolysing)